MKIIHLTAFSLACLVSNSASGQGPAANLNEHAAFASPAAVSILVNPVAPVSATFGFPNAQDERGTLIFEDDFQRNETQEKTDEIGNGWGSNSKSRAAGNKQVDLKNGAMYIYRHEVADHGVSVTTRRNSGMAP